MEQDARFLRKVVELLTGVVEQKEEEVEQEVIVV